MPPGRPSKSDTEKKARGTFRPSRATGVEVTPEIKVRKRGGRKRKTALPIHKLEDDAKKMYDEAVRILEAYKTISDIDYHHISMMAYEFDVYIKHISMPMIEINPNTGLSQIHASVRIRNMALDKCFMIAKELQLTNYMRSRIRTKEESKDHDPLAEFVIS